MVTELETWDFQSYCRGLPELTVRVHRDEKFIEKLEKALDEFTLELVMLVRDIRNKGAK